MKALFRAFGMLAAGIYFMLSLMTLGQLNIIETELNDTVSQAMTQTQIVMREQIEDRYYNTHNARITWTSDASGTAQDKYIAYFIDTLKGLKSNPNVKYTVYVYAADVDKGLLSVEVVADFIRPNGTFASSRSVQTSCKKIGIIDVVRH